MYHDENPQELISTMATATIPSAGQYGDQGGASQCKGLDCDT
jgi:hypothetical protein